MSVYYEEPQVNDALLASFHSKEELTKKIEYWQKELQKIMYGDESMADYKAFLQNEIAILRDQLKGAV